MERVHVILQLGQIFAQVGILRRNSQREFKRLHGAVSCALPQRESPQALIVRAGQVLWDASHGGITKPRLEQAFGTVQPAGE